MNPADADRNLLFGILALQNGLIGQVELVAAFQSWTMDKGRSLADHLVGRGDLDALVGEIARGGMGAVSRAATRTWAANCLKVLLEEHRDSPSWSAGSSRRPRSAASSSTRESCRFTIWARSPTAGPTSP